MNTCAAGALVTDRSKRGSSSRPCTLGMPICTGGSSARSSDSGRAGALRSPVRPSSADNLRLQALGRAAARRSRRRASSAKRERRASRRVAFVPAGRAGRLSMFGCISSTSRSPFLLQHRDRIGDPGERAIAHRGAERDHRAVDHRELASGRSDDRLQSAGGRCAAPGRAGGRERPAAASDRCSPCARASLCARAHAKAIATDNPITFRTWPLSSFSLLTLRMPPPALAGKQAIT